MIHQFFQQIRTQVTHLVMCTRSMYKNVYRSIVHKHQKESKVKKNLYKMQITIKGKMDKDNHSKNVVFDSNIYNAEEMNEP